jgi:flavin-binding protein dodecin
MTKKKRIEVTGYSTQGIREALRDALDQLDTTQRIQVVETRGVQSEKTSGAYEVTLTTLDDYTSFKL